MSSSSLDKPCLQICLHLSADLSAISKVWGGRSKARKALKGEGPRHGKTKKLCRQSLSKMQTKFCRQTLSRRVPPKCRQRLSKMQTRALNFCRNRRQIMQTNFVYPPGGDACILVRLHNVAGVVYSENADKVCLQFSADFLQTKFVCRVCLQGLSARSGNADKVCLRA